MWIEADRSAAHPSSFRALPVAYRVQLPALKTVFVDDHADSAPAAIGKTAHHSPPAVHLYIGFRAHNIGGKRDRKIHRRTHRHIRIHAEQHSIGGNIFGFDRLSVTACLQLRPVRLPTSMPPAV